MADAVALRSANSLVHQVGHYCFHAIGLQAFGSQVVFYTADLTSGMCSRSCEVSSIENNLATEGLEANSMKAVVTDLMQESANSLVQLADSCIRSVTTAFM